MPSSSAAESEKAAGAVSGVNPDAAWTSGAGAAHGSSIPSAHEVVKEISEVQKQMVALARELRFEEAAVLRDHMQKLKQLLLMLPGRE